MENKDKKNTYYFQGLRFVPVYRDFDYEDYKIEASGVKEAWKLLAEFAPINTWNGVAITHINGIKLEEDIFYK